MTARRLAIVLLLIGGVTWLLVTRPDRNPPRTVVLISLDTLRPDRLGVYGGPAGNSPHLDALASESVVFDQVLANSPWTLPSHMTMLTGLDPVAHGVRRDGYALSGRVITLAETLRDAGFRTGAFTAGGNVTARFGFGQGFSVYRETVEPGGGPAGFARILPEAIEWLGKGREDTFLFLHTFDAHAPYDVCAPETLERFRARPVKDGLDDHQLHRLSFLYQQERMRVTNYPRFAELLNDYDAGVHEADAGVGQVIEALKASGRYENALILITSDHGESFADHGVHIGHGIGLTDDELRIPLVMRLPQQLHGGQRIDTLTDLVDIAPTVLDVMGVTAPVEMQGESLAKLAGGAQRRRDYVMGVSQNTEACFIVRGGYKFILSPPLPPLEIARRHLGPMTPPAPGANPGEEYIIGSKSVPNPIKLRYDFDGDPLGIRDVLLEVPQLYDRVRDPGERTNLWKQEPKKVEELSRFLLERFVESAALNESLDDGQTPQPSDPHEEQNMLALGYLSAADPMDARAALSQLPDTLRQPLKNPYEAPDIRPLVDADRFAHITRRRLEAGLELPENVPLALQEIGNRYVAWAVKNPAYVARVRWRVEALTELAQEAGVTLDMDGWRQRFVSLNLQAAREMQKLKEQREQRDSERESGDATPPTDAPPDAVPPTADPPAPPPAEGPASTEPGDKAPQ